MADIIDYFAMGGYGGYIWPAYGVTAALLIVLLITSRRMLRNNQATFEALAPTETKHKKDGTVEEKT